MALEQKLSLKLSQRLVMTPSLQQAIKLLQMSTLELRDEISTELQENPALADALLQRHHSDAVLEPSARAALGTYHWPGNVRELKNVLTRAYVLYPSAP